MAPVRSGSDRTSQRCNVTGSSGFICDATNSVEDSGGGGVDVRRVEVWM